MHYINKIATVAMGIAIGININIYKNNNAMIINYIIFQAIVYAGHISVRL